MADRIQIRRDTAANWASANPVLAVGEQGYETDTGKMKIGNGSSTWNTLSYFADTSSVDAATLDGLDSTDFATAAQGALADSAIQSADLATVATSGSYTDLSDQPTIPSITGLATETYVDTAVNNLVDTAPAALDTLNELAAALGDDADFAGTVTTSLAAKANTADLATVATTGAYSDLTGAPTIPSTLTDLSITDGTAGQVLSADGDGTYTFIDAASGGGGSFEAVASGEISVGNPVILNANGTVSIITQTTSVTTGSLVTYETDTLATIPSTYVEYMAYDTINNKIVILMGIRNPDAGNQTQELRARVITIADGVISTIGDQVSVAVAPPSAGTRLVSNGTVAFDPVAQKFLILWNSRYGDTDATIQGVCKVATVSGNTLTFGAESIIQNEGGIKEGCFTFVPGANKFLASYESYTSTKNMRVATISGTDVTFGAVYTPTFVAMKGQAAYVGSNKVAYLDYNGGNIGLVEIVGTSVVGLQSSVSIPLVPPSGDRDFAGIGYDSNADRIVLYISGEYSSYVTAENTSGGFNQVLTATVSNSNIFTFGTATEVVDNSGNRLPRGWYPRIKFNSTDNKLLISLYGSSWPDTSGNYSLEATVQGDTISVTTPTRHAGGGFYSGLVYDPSSNTYIVYNDIKQMFTISYESVSNLTAENYAGIADAAYADAATATIQTAGSVDDAQSGLTPGQAYYVQANGTLGLTPDTPSVFAGTAVSATSLLIGKEAPASTVAYADVTGTPDLSSYATETYVDTAVSNLVDTAPDALNTLNELAASLNDDADFAGTVTTSLAAKANSADLATVATSGSYTDLTGTPTLPSALTDLSITDGTAGQVLSADGDGTYTFIDAASGGGSGGTASFTSTTDLTAGDLVALSTSGTVSGITTQAQTLHSSPVQPSGAATKLYDNVSVAKISDTKYVLAYRNNSGYPVVYIATVGADNTVTTGTQYTFSTTTSSEGIDLFWNPIDEIGVVVSTTANQVKYQYFTVSGSAVSYQGISGSGTYANEYHAVYNYETNEIWVSWFGSNYSARYGGLHKAVWDGSTIAITNYSLGFTLRSEKNYNINALTTWGTDKVIGQWYDGYYSPARRWDQVFDTSTETWTTVATTDIYDDEGLQYLTYNPEDNIVVGMKSLDTAPGWVEYSESGGVITKGANFPVATDVDGNAITWGTNDIVDAKFINGKTYILSQSVYEQAFMYSLERIGQNDYNIELIFDEAVPGSYDMGRMARDSFAPCGSGLVYVEGLSLRKLDFADLSVTNIGDFIGISTETVTANNPAVISIVGGINTNQSGLTPNLKYYATAVGALTTTLTDYPVGIATSATELLVTESYTSTQKKTDLQLATVATTGAYSDLTGTPTGLATETYVDTAVNNLVDTAPDALNTLNELAASLNDDADFAGTVTTSLAAKANSADLAAVATSGSYNDLTDQPTIPADVSDLTDTTSLLGGGGGSFEAVASGSLSDGSTVVLNSDGTVSVVAETGYPEGAGTASAFESATTSYTSATFDSNSNKVIIAYADYGNAGYGTAVVGTVSGTSISFGTPVVFESADSTYITATFDSNSNRVVIAYRDDGAGGYGTAVVGTVSGTSISFGTPVVFHTGDTRWNSITFDSTSNKVVIAYEEYLLKGTAVVGTVSGTSISFGTPVIFQNARCVYNSITFDSNSSKVVISYRNVGNSNYGTAIVGTVSGTSISFGTPAVFLSEATAHFSSTFDSTNNKVVVAFQHSASSDHGTAVVGTVSGTSISFGTPVVFENSATSETSTTFDTASNKVLISYKNGGNAQFGTVAIGTVSGTSISFDTPVVFESALTSFVSSTFDSNSNKTVISYRDDGNSSYGMAIVYNLVVETTTNLTAENYAGISDGVYADAATATIQTAGSVDDAQSGLTPGQAYYVQADGTLGLTPDTPRVFAGVAASATKLLIGKEGPAVDLSSYASTSYVDTAVSNLVDTAPDALNTLNELAASLNDDADFAGTVTTSLSTKLGTDSVIDGGTV